MITNPKVLGGKVADMITAMTEKKTVMDGLEVVDQGAVEVEKDGFGKGAGHGEVLMRRVPGRFPSLELKAGAGDLGCGFAP